VQRENKAVFADEYELQAGQGGGERDKDKRPEQTQQFRHRHYQVRAPSGFGRAARTRLFRLINMQNGALRAPPRPSRVTIWEFKNILKKTG
jgi:hypothetical protein